MSRLADILSTTVAQNPSAAGVLGSANATAAREAAALGDFQALFSQEIAAQTLGSSALSATPAPAPAASPEQEEQKDLAQALDPTAPKAAELMAWLTLPPLPETPVQVHDVVPEARLLLPQGGSGKSTGRLEPALGSPPTTAAADARGAGFALPGSAAGVTSVPSGQARLERAPSNTFVPNQTSTSESSEVSRDLVDLRTFGAKTVAPQEAGAETPQHTPEALAPAVAPPSLASAMAVSRPVFTAQVQAAVGAPHWREEFGEKILMISRQEMTSAHLSLNPPQLGPIEVSITVKHDQAQASFAAASAPVREAIEAAIPRLREMFADAGLSLGNAFVSQQFSQTGQAFSQPGEGTKRGEEGDALGGAREKSEQTTVVRRRGLGLVDTFA